MARDPSRILDRFALAAGEARDALSRAGVPRWELYAKASEWEEVTRRSGREDTVVRCRETGLAVRTRRGGRSGFAAASGGDPAVWRTTVETALATERAESVDPLPPRSSLGTVPVRPAEPPPPRGWGREVLDRLGNAVGSASAGRLQLVRGVLRTGSAGWLIHTAEGFSATHRGTACLLVAEVAAVSGRLPGWRRVLPIRSPAALDPEAIAHRLVNPLLLLGRASAPRTGITDLLLDPFVAAHLLAGIVPLLLAPRTAPPVGERLGSVLLEIEDDRAGEVGPLAAPCDGEGLPAFRLPLVERGILVRRLASHRDAILAGLGQAGGAVRPGYREPPATGISNLYLRPSPGLESGALIDAAGRALYLLDLAGPPEIDLEADRYRLAGLGLTIEGGTVTAWHPLVEVKGRVRRLLDRLDATGTTVTWHQTATGVVGTPPLLFRAQLVG